MALRRRARHGAHPFSRAGACPGADSDSGCGHYYYDDYVYVYRSGPGSPPNALLLLAIGRLTTPER